MEIGIVTIIDKNNYGNRLQNYALNYYCNNELGVKTYTLDNKEIFNNKNCFYINKLKEVIKKNIGWNKEPIINANRRNNFLEFDKNIHYYKKQINACSDLNIFDYIIVGSDQVWNPVFDRLSDLDVLKNAKPEKRISYSASFGVDKVEDQANIKNEISKFKAISVREETGRKIIEEATGRTDVEVLIDPTMLLTAEEWDEVSKKPEQLKGKKYILNYFLGDLSDKRKKEISRIAKENNCEIINILDPNDPMYECGPAEFLYLEKNAFLICTDSFHSSVFAILYNKPFIIFDREQAGVVNMNSRLETLLNKFNLKNRKYNEKSITKENLNHNYEEAYKILEIEREKSKIFLQKAIK